MKKEIAYYIKNLGFNTIITNQYISKDVYDNFNHVVSLTNTRSVISAAIGFNLFDRFTLAYITNIFQFLYIYDDSYKDLNLNLLTVINNNKLPKNYDIRGLLNNYGIRYIRVGKEDDLSIVDDIINYVLKNNGSSFIILEDGFYDELHYD